LVHTALSREDVHHATSPEFIDPPQAAQGDSPALLPQPMLRAPRADRFRRTSPQISCSDGTVVEPVSERRWLLRTAPPEAALLDRLSETLEVPPLVARLLAHRGLESDTAGGFLQNRLADLPDPFLLPDMEFAVRRLQRAIEQGERIAVHGDYDVDGITGTALLCSLLTALDGQVDYHIPLRLRDGYGLSATALRRAAQEGVALVISVDCGVSAVEEAALARELGLELIITDHHQPPEVLPTALAVINPQRPDSLFPCADLAGVGVAFFLLIALRQRLRESGWFNQRP
jgi:single-stranded-DNA-specific exonuclease